MRALDLHDYLNNYQNWQNPQRSIRTSTYRIIQSNQIEIIACEPFCDALIGCNQSGSVGILNR
jgi:hypothetical protein